MSVQPRGFYFLPEALAYAGAFVFSYAVKLCPA